MLLFCERATSISRGDYASELSVYAGLRNCNYKTIASITRHKVAARLLLVRVYKVKCGVRSVVLFY
jgi:hypothetical protein